ncbi:MAG: hypothetical protein AAFR49_09385 [Pseudomonadota bacterium]
MLDTVAAYPDLGIQPGQIFRVFGLRRSGNHAIINWLSRNAPGRTIFFNNCRAGQSPFAAHNGIEVDGKKVGHPGADANPHVQEAGEGASVFVSYENLMPSTPRRKPISGPLDLEDITRDVIIARDFLNWAASLVKKVQGNAELSAHQRMAFALRLVDVYGDMLDLATQEDPSPPVIIRYDAWLEDANYRADVLQKMGFEQQDDSTGRVEAYGNGSSFQPEATDAQELRPLDRWKAMHDDPEYRTIVWLALQDRSFAAKLEQVFPESIGPLGELASKAPYII